MQLIDIGSNLTHESFHADLPAVLVEELQRAAPAARGQHVEPHPLEHPAARLRVAPVRR